MKHKKFLLVMLLLLGFSYSNAQYGPIVSFTYDDGYPSWYDIGFPLYQQYGFQGVAYINATNSWVIAPGSIDKLHEMQAAGWEISSHTFDHSGITEYTVSEMKSWLDSHGFPNSGFCAPGHAWSHEMVNIVKKYHPYYSATYLIPTDVGISTQPLDLYFMKRFPLDNSVTITQVKAVLDDAVQNNRWVIFYGHVIGSTPGGWEQSPALLQATFDEVIARGIPVKTVKEVINDLFPPGGVIECSVDSLQYPVLNYFEEGDSSLNTSVWNEYWHITNWSGPRYPGSPVVYCHSSNDSLPVMKFYRNVPDGEYDVVASIIEYDANRTYRLYYSFDEGNPSQFSVDVTKNSDVSLGTVTVTNGQFALYTQKADVVSGSDGFVGWAFIKLFPKPLLLNLKVFLEGPYIGSGAMAATLNTQGLIPKYQPFKTAPWNYLGTESAATFPANFVDWVMIELRSDSATVVSRRAGLLLSDGSVIDTDGSSPLAFKGLSDGNYYVVVRHRNHLPIMSANPVTLLKGTSVSYDFSTSQTQAYGTNPMKVLGENIFGMYSADGNDDGGIYGEDYILYQASQGEEGYRIEDYNMDGGVYGEDYILYQLNQGAETWVP
ncbi:MAG: polysaccharide deacetylase family protein [Ignavibacteriaceae bacterium]|nr:polysaccharide deacetylase family protein [Ignavibacteriaceae bacterium]